GFIIHPINLENLETYFFPSFRDHDIDRVRLKDWWNRMSRFLEPVHVGSDTIRANDYLVENSLVLLPYLPEYIMAAKEAHLGQEIRDKVQDAVTLAKELGDENIPQSVVGLGAYSSIATNNGLSLNDHEMSVTTGNAFTVAMALRGIQKAVAGKGLLLDQCTVSVVGAGGNIGQAIARAMAPFVGKLVLIGSPRASSLRRLEATKMLCGAVEVELATDLGPLKRSQVAVLATSSSEANLVRPGMVPDGSVVCCVSTPSNLSPDFEGQDRVLAFDGGMARLPEGSAVNFLGLPRDGAVHGCLGETLLLGFEGFNHSFCKGLLEPWQVHRTLEWAEEYGFTLGPLRLHGKTVME
ncbi:MAG TPA: hypothetical protein VK786_06640, partial [bacterium]|nr:hypothetical protein [bacterium]